MAKQLNVDVNLNTAQAEAKLKNLQSLLSQAITSSSKSSAGGLTNDIVQATKAAADLKVMLNQAMNPSTGNLDLSRFSQQLAKSKTSLNDYAKSLTKLGPQGQQAFMSLSKSIVSAEVPMRESGKLLNELGTTFKNTLRWQATSSLIHNLIGGIQSAMSYARGLDSSLNSIRIVTGLSADEMSKFAKSANESAKALSASTLDYTDAALIYYQQGIRDQKQIKERTDATIKMANVTGTSAQKVSDQLTAIWNNFADGSTNLEYYADVITALGAATASSSAEISAGLSKFAAVADTVGLSYEYATSALATVVATTRQSADVVGTALKTLFARVQSLNLGETLDDGTTLGKYSKALDQVGISIKDQSGALRDMDDILNDMGAKWKTLNKDQQVALAQTVAGQRQYTQLVALMDNWDFMQENLKVAYGSTGELQKQADIYAESWDAARTRVRAAAQGIYDDLISDKFFIGFNDALAGMLGGIDKFVDALGGIPGTLGLLGTVFTKVFSQQIGQSLERSIQSFKVFTGIAKVEAKSVREQAITASQTFTPGKTADKSLQMQSSSLQQQLVLANQYQNKMEAIAKAGGQVAASDKQRIASLMQIVELTQEAAIAAQQQVEASEIAQSQASANIARNMKARAIKDNGGKELTKEQRQEINDRVNSLGVQRKNLQQDYLALSARERLRAENYNLTTSQLMGISGLFKRQEQDFKDRAQSAKKRAPNDAMAGTGLLRRAQLTAEARALIESGEYANINKQYKAAQRKKASLKGQDTAVIDAEIANLESKLKDMGSKIAKALKNVGNDIKMAEELALQDMVGESESTQNKFFDAIREQAESTINAEDLEDQGNEFLEDAAEEIEKLQAADFSPLVQGLTSAMSGVSSLAMGFSSLKSGIEAINDESLSFGDKILQAGMSFGMAVPMITSGLGSIASGFGKIKTGGGDLIAKAFAANTAAGFAGAAGGATGLTGAFKSFVANKRFDRAALKALRKNPSDIFAAYNAGQTALWAKGGSRAMMNNADALERAKQLQAGTAGKGAGAAAGGLSALQIAGIVAALAALAVIIAKVKKEIHEASLEGQLEKAVEQGNQLSSALDEAKNSAESLKSAFDSYHSIADTLNKCTTGTREWAEALRENNNEVISLMAQYPELAKIQGAIQKNADGSLSISQEAEQQMNKMAQDRVDTLSWAKLANQELQQSLQDQMDLKTRSREMLEMQKAGRDIGHYAQGMEYKTDVRTSDFDTDMIGGFSFAVGGDGASLEAAERAQLRAQKGAGQLTEISANQRANELLLENWDQLQALSGESLTEALGKVMSEGGLKITSDDLARYSAAVETANYRGEMTKFLNEQKAQQQAFETQQIGLVANRLASEGVLDNDTKTRDLVSNIFGKQLDERTKAQVAADKEAYNRGGEERKALAEAYVRAMGGDANSISWKGNEFSYLDSEGQKIEGITAAMVSSVTGAASALEELAGAAEAAAGAMKEIPKTEAGDAVRDFLENGDLTKTSTQGLKDIFGLQLEGTAFSSDKLRDSLVAAAGGKENAAKIADAMGLSLGDFITQLGEAALQEKQWYNSAQRQASIAGLHLSTGADEDRLENYSRAELEARQRYEDSKVNRGSVKTLQELETAAEAAGNAQEYLNRTWKDGTHLTGEQMAGLKDIISDTEQYGLVIDESTGKVKDASLLYDMLNKSVSDVGVEATRAQMPIYEQLNDLYADLADNSANYSEESQAGILQEIELLEQEISKYKQLAIAQSGAAQAYSKIAEGKEWDEAHDYTDELNSAVGSIYSHMEQDDNGNWDWSTLERGSHEVQAALDALLPKNVRERTSPEWMDAQQYIEFMYGNSKKDGRYRSKEGDITKKNVENFIKDASGEAPYGDFTGFARDIDLAEGKMTLLTDEMGEFQDQISLKDAAESMHMTEAAFLSMITAMDKYNESGGSFLDYFNLEGAEFATQLEANAHEIKDAAEEVQEAFQDTSEGAGERQQAALDRQTKALQEQAKLRKQAIDDAFEYKAATERRDELIDKSITGSLTENEQAELDQLQQRIAELESEDIEIKVTFATDENAIESIKQTLQSSDVNELGDISQSDLNSMMQKVAAAEDSAKVLSETGLDKMIGDMDKLSEGMQKKVTDALTAAGKDPAWLKGITQGIKEATEGDDNQPELDPTVNTDNWDKFKSDVDSWAKEPIEKEVKFKNPEEGKEGTSTSDYTGSTSHNPRFEGSTQGVTNKSGQTKGGGSNPKIKVELDTTEAQGKLDTFTASIAAIPATIPLSISGNITNVSDHIATLSGLLHSLGGAVPVLTITDNTAEVGGKIQQLKTKALQLNGIKPRITISSNASAVLGTVSSLKTALSTLPSTKVINVSVNVTGEEQLNGIQAYGTARAYGNAFESGKWGTGKGPMSALVGELGQELVVDPSSGKFYTVGNSGAEFVKLPKNAIVFNHRQTEELLKYRKINSRGQAMVEGNAYARGDSLNDIQNIIADIFNRDTFLTTYRSTAAAAAENERAEYEQKLVTILRDEVDLYATIERTIKRVERHLKDFTRNLDRLYGDDLINNYKKAIEESHKLYETNLKARDIAADIYKSDLKRGNNITIQWQEKAPASYSTADKPAYNTNLATQNWTAYDLLTQYGNMDASGITRGANGEILDIDPTLVDLAIKTIQRRAEDNWNLSQDESKTQADRVAAENAAQWFDSIVKSLTTWYQQVADSEDKVAEFNEAAQDALEQTHDYAVELIRKEFEMRIKLQENELKLIDLKLKRLGDGFFKTAERMALAFDKDNAFDLTKDNVFARDIMKADAAIKEYEDVKTLLANANENDRQAYAATQEKFMETTQEAFDELTNEIADMIEKAEDQMNAWSEALSKSRGVLESYTDQLHHVTTMLGHIKDILDLTGQKYNYSMKDSVLKSTVNSINNEAAAEAQYYEVLRKNREAAEAHWLQTKATMSEEAAQLEYEKYVLPSIQMEQESLEKKTELYKEALQTIEQIWENSLEEIMAKWDESVTNGEGFDWLSESMQRAKSIQEQYLTTTNKLYETNTLMRKVQNDIDKTSSKISKEKLANFNKEIEAAQNSEKLSKNSMEILKARYELLQAELALEEAKDAKSVVRLQRDSEGNYGYVYTADQDKVDDAEQDLADKQNDLYNLVLGIQNDSQELRLQVQQEYHAAAQQLYDDFYNKHLMSQEEYDAKLAELKRQAEEKLLAIDGDITESAFWLNQVAADGVSEAWGNSYDDRMAKTDQFMECFNSSSDQVIEAISTIDALREESSERADVDLNTLDEDISNLTTTSNLLAKEVEGTVIPAIEKELEAVAAETQGFWDQYDAIMAAIEARRQYAAQMQADMKAVSGSYADDAYAPDWSLEMMKAAAAGDWDAYNNALTHRTTKIELSGGFDAGKHKMTAEESDAAIRGYAAKGMSVEQMNAAYQKDSASLHPEINVTVNVDGKKSFEKTKVNSKVDVTGAVGADTGMYTGSWGSEGKLAVLHEKELVLNKDDTSNILSAVGLLRGIDYQTKLANLQYGLQLSRFNDMLTSSIGAIDFTSGSQELQQQVHITAEFPNVSEHTEIEKAFDNLVNRAAQYAARDNWVNNYQAMLTSST